MVANRTARLPLHLAALIVGITIVPMGTMVWLGGRLLEQDRVLERQQIQQRVERGADLAVAALQRAVAASEQRLTSGDQQWPDGAGAIVFRDGSVQAFPPGAVAYLPVMLPLKEAPDAVFAQGEDLEHRQQNPAGAVSVYRQLAASPEAAVRAGALFRLARALSHDGRLDEAIEAYRRLSSVDDVSVRGVPVGLVSTYAHARLLEQQQRWPELHTVASALDKDLRSGRWTLTAPVYFLYEGDAATWTGTSPEPALAEAEVFGDAVGTLWERWKSTRWESRFASGREILDTRGETLTILWQRSDDSFRALIAAPAFVESQWLAAVVPVVTAQHLSFKVVDAHGRRVAGRRSDDAGPFSAVRSAADSTLPWSIAITSLTPPPEDGEFLLRRRLLIAGLALLICMALTASYLIVRAVSRETAVARLQSDFVAAVSHEFRTPLTALRQFTEMLREQPALDEARRHLAYDAQARATERLTRLVESLLDFGRTEAGARQYRFQPHDCADLIDRVVEDFRQEASASGHDLTFGAHGSAQIEADDEALSRAVRNLLDNAVKYTPEPAPVEVTLERRNGHVLISVVDHGIGIPSHEQAKIFAKFQRGELARTLGIRGTGIGLAMVDEIIKAHNGRVDVESEPGKGSTFTIVLPTVGPLQVDG